MRGVRIGSALLATLAVGCTMGDPMSSSDVADSGRAATDGGTPADTATQGGCTGAMCNDASPSDDAAVNADDVPTVEDSAMGVDAAPAHDATTPGTDASSAHDAGSPDAHTGSRIAMVGTGEYRVYYLVDGCIYGLGDLLGNTGGESMGVPLPLDVPATTRFTYVQSGLHESLAVDSAGHVWAWGQNEDGQAGLGTMTHSVDRPTMIPQDADGHPFTDVVSVYCHIGQSFAVKSDGSVWFWGDGRSGDLGDPAHVGLFTRPMRVPMPAGVHVTRLAVSDIVLARASDGSVWSWGNVGAYGHEVNLGNGADGTMPRRITALPATVVEVASATHFNYALTSTGDLWGWGMHSDYMGRTTGTPVTPPTSMNHELGLASPVHAVGVNDETTHVVLDDGTLWGWGAAGQGGVGNGVEYDFSTTDPPYGSWGGAGMMQVRPVRIAPAVNTFESVWSLPVFGFYVYAQTRDGQLYFMGRNKNGIAGNGVYPGAASGSWYAGTDVAATFPSSWNVPTATAVSPMTLTHGTATLSPYCIAHPTVAPCNDR